MVTLVPGQKVRQRLNDRIWEITARAASSPGGARRWRITLITPSPRYDDRQAGEWSDCTEQWLNTNCEDWPDLIQPPCGDGEQVVRICYLNRRIVEQQQFQRAADAVAYAATCLLEPGRTSQHAEWYGWLVEAEDLPDLVARLGDDGELVWAEVVHGVA